jgi:hypothetical protein
MKRSKLARTLTGLTAALALTAITATTATAALPEFNYKGLPRFTLKGSKVAFDEAGGHSYSCEVSKGEGKITGKKTATATLTLNKCSAPLGATCQSTGASIEEIKTGTLPVELVYTSKANHEAGLIFNYEATKKNPLTTFASWYCESLLGGKTTGLGVRGSIIAPVTPVNTKTGSYTTKFEATKEVQSPTTYETETGEKLTAFPELALISEHFAEGAMTNQWTLTNIASEGEFEIKA